MMETSVATADLREGVEKYVSKTLHTDIQLRPMPDTSSLPPYLTHSYDFYQAPMKGQLLIFMIKTREGGTPAEWAKHLSSVREKKLEPTVFVAGSLSPHNRSRLIEQAVPFVIPGNQLYLPDLALDLRDHFLGSKTNTQEALTPAAQAVLFYHLLGFANEHQTSSQIAAKLGYTAMSISRAFDELTGAQLATTPKSGRERYIRYERDKKSLFDAAKPKLRTPVRSKRYAGQDLDGLGFKLAGEAALSRLSSLGYSEFPIYATTLTRWKSIREKYGLLEVAEDEAQTELEIWSYDPAALSETWTADPLSLYAQFWNHPDERVAMAAEDILGTVNWLSE